MKQWIKQNFGLDKPVAATAEDWDIWFETSKKNFPVRYFLTESVPTFLTVTWRRITDPFWKVRSYFRNRFINKTHRVPGLVPGRYYEFDDKLEAFIFGSIVEFVEKECARHNFNTETQTKADGIDYLYWSMGLTFGESYGVEPSDLKFGQPTGQAIAAKKIFDVYFWYTERLPLLEAELKELHDTQFAGFGKDGKFSFKITEEDKEYFERTRKIEDEIYSKKTELMKTVVEIRNQIWT